MQLFIDTANIDEIREIASWGVIRGVTTNPKVFSTEAVADMESRVKEILEIVNGPLSLEVTTNDFDEMLAEGERYAAWHPNVVVKVPMSEAGLRAVVELSRKGIKTNVTAIMAVNQAILAAQAGATYASIFLARIGDLGYDPIQVIREAVELYEKNRVTTRIIVGSIRHLMHINQAASAGAHIITVPYKFFHQMAHHPQTEATIQEFLQSWNQARLPI